MIEDLIEIKAESSSDNGLVQRGCATVVDGEMMYFGGSFNPKQVCYNSIIMKHTMIYCNTR